MTPDTKLILLKWTLDQLSRALSTVIPLAVGALSARYFRPNARRKPTRKGTAPAVPKRTGSQARTALPKAGVKRTARND